MDAQVPILTRDQLQAIPDAEWPHSQIDFIYEAFMERIKTAAAP